MSIYYECRFNKLKLNLTERPDILQWINDCKNIRDEIKKGNYKNLEPRLPIGISSGSRCEQLFYNSFEGKDSYDNELYVNTKNCADVTIDYTLGNKNKDNDIFQVIALLSKYYVSGDIILWDECDYRVFNIEKLKEVNLNPTNIDKSFDSSEYYDFNNVKGEELFYEDLLYENSKIN